MKNLYLIGNGFDIHHGINSSYAAYRRWLLDNNPGLYDTMKDYYLFDEHDGKRNTEENEAEWWNDFEKNLGLIHLHDYLYLKSLGVQPDFNSEHFMDLDQYTVTTDIEYDIGGMVDEIKDSFSEWIKSLKPADKGRKLTISTEDNFFINFNYTHTLQDVYNIPDHLILHIHGDLSKGDFVIGHNKTFSELLELAGFEKPAPPDEYIPDRLAEYYQEDFEEFKIRIYNEASVKEVMKIKKNVNRIIHNNQDTFNKCSEVEGVYVYGVSFSDVDLPYLYEVASKLEKRNAHWTVSCYSRKDYDNCMKFFNNIHLDKSLLHIIKLRDIQVIKQLDMFDSIMLS